MKLWEGRPARWTAARRPSEQFQFWVLLVASVVIFLMSRAGHPWIGTAQRELGGAVAPVVDALNLPMRGAILAGEWIDGIIRVHDENQELKATVAELEGWRAAAEALDIENRRLREVLNAPETGAETLASARVIAVAGGPYVRSVLVNAGRQDGLREGLAVISDEGVVGRTILVGPAGSRVLLITDLNSRLPVRVERSTQNGIALGRNDNLLDLGFLPVDPDVQIGDRVLTSGYGGVFPPDLIVGEVVQVDGDTIRIQPAADLAALDFVRVLDFSAAASEPPADESDVLAEEGSQPVAPPTVASDNGEEG